MPGERVATDNQAHISPNGLSMPPVTSVSMINNNFNFDNEFDNVQGNVPGNVSEDVTFTTNHANEDAGWNVLNGLSISLMMKTDKKRKRRVNGQTREVEMPGANITSMQFSTPLKWDETRSDLIYVRPEEMSQVAFRGEELCIETSSSLSSRKRMRMSFPTDEETGSFTVRQVLDNVLDFERAVRPHTEWFGGVDVGHVFFDGLVRDEATGRYSVRWGS